MAPLFLTVLNMSLNGAFVVAVIFSARFLFLKKAPAAISYYLWSVAGFRLLFPFSIDSVFSLVPFKAMPIPVDIATYTVPRTGSGIFLMDNAANALPSTAAASVNLLQFWTAAAYIWLAGVVLMLVYAAFSFIVLNRKMANAVHVELNIYESPGIQSPFVLGFISPKIYLPFGLKGHERGYILLHEQTHIKRRDHFVKFAAYFILCLHWFNPLAWVAFVWMNEDMEMSCDERVLHIMGGGIRKDYSLLLVSMAAERRFIGGCPLAFGENGLKERVKNVLHFDKPPRRVVALVILLSLFLGVGLLANRGSAENNPLALPAIHGEIIGASVPVVHEEIIGASIPADDWEGKREVASHWMSRKSEIFQIVWVEKIDDETLGGRGIRFDDLQEFQVGYDVFKEWIDVEIAFIRANHEDDYVMADLAYTEAYYQRVLSNIQTGEAQAFIIPWGYNTRKGEVGAIMYIHAQPYSDGGNYYNNSFLTFDFDTFEGAVHNFN